MKQACSSLYWCKNLFKRKLYLRSANFEAKFG